MMFSAGLPILYPFACIAFFVLYWVYKFLLLKYYEKTTRFNEQLPLYSITWIKFSILLHGVVGLFMYTNSDLFPQNDPYAGKIEAMLKFIGGWGELFQERFFQRSYSVIYFLFWICVVIWFVAKHTVLKLFWKLVSCTCNSLIACCTSDDEPLDSVHSDDFYSELLIAPLKTLIDTANDDVEAERHRIQKNESFNPDTAKEHRYPEEVEVAKEAFLQKLEQRLEQIEHLVNDHLQYLNDLNKNDAYTNAIKSPFRNKDGTRNIESREQKFEILVKQQPELRQSEKRCRMQTKTQSYNMYHSKTLRHIDELKEKLDEPGAEYWLGKEEGEPKPAGPGEPEGDAEKLDADK
jgi:hypothetical protein